MKKYKKYFFKFFHFILVVAINISNGFSTSENIIYKIDIANAVKQGDAVLSATGWDIGHVDNCFDGDTTTIMRSANTNPAYVQISFKEHILVGKSRVFLEYQNDWWLEAADNQEDLDNKMGTYQLVIPGRPAGYQIWDEYILSAPVSAKIWKFNINRTVGDNYVHIAELELWTDITIDQLIVTPNLLQILPYEAGKMICLGHNDTLDENYDVSRDVTWYTDNPNVVIILDDGSFRGKIPGIGHIWAEFSSLQSNSATIIVDKEDVALLIDRSIYQQLEQNLSMYKQDVEFLFPIDLFIHADTNFNSLTAAQIRGYIHDLYNNQSIDGIILAGSIPYALWQNREPENRGINSFYYEDLDGIFTDTDNDGCDDYHQWGNHIGPEVWVCWMRPPANNEVVGLKTFLEKTHAYYTGNISFNHRAFAVAHGDYDMTLYEGDFFTVQRLTEIYGETNVDVDGVGSDQVKASDYLTALENNRYEILDPTSHAWSEGQYLDPGETVYSTQIRDLTGGAIMTFIYGCHSGAFNESPNLNIAMMYVMGTSIGQVASGTSWSYGNGERRYLYDVLKAGGYVGRGWMDLITRKNNPEYIKKCYGESADTSQHLWGDNLIGNPFVCANFNNFVPVKLSSFTAMVIDNDVHLAWVTVTESDNFGFEIERRVQHSTEWHKIGFVPGNGTTVNRIQYNFVDHYLPFNDYEYRLKQIDADGSFSYSKIIAVQVGLLVDFSLLQNYPNPFNSSTVIEYILPSSLGSNANVKLKIYNLRGEEIVILVDELQCPGYYKVVWDGKDKFMRNSNSGLYFYRIQLEKYCETKKMLLVR